MTHMRRAAASCLFVAAFVPGIGAQQHVSVFAAASLRDPFQEIGALLEARQPGLKVDFNFAGSNALALQIGQHAPADVFASADLRWMSYVVDSLHAATAAESFTRNRLAVIVPRANPGRVVRPQDLARTGLKIVVAADPVPVGQYTREALAKMSASADFGADFAARVERNVVSREENVKAVVTKVQLGEADAGFVYRSDVSPSMAPLVTILDIPDAMNIVATYPIAVVSASRNAAAARAFVALVLSKDGQQILSRYHFDPVPAGKR
jgi:molybdate transport system substrate-binding protein